MFQAPCAHHHQEVKIVLYSIWYHHTCGWPSGAQVERGQNIKTPDCSVCQNNGMLAGHSHRNGKWQMFIVARTETPVKWQHRLCSYKVNSSSSEKGNCFVKGRPFFEPGPTDPLSWRFHAFPWSLMVNPRQYDGKQPHPSQFIIYVYTHYLLSPRSSVLLEKLTGFQIVKKFPPFYGTQRFITAFTSASTCHYPEPSRSSPYPHIPLPKNPSYYYHPI